MYGNGMYCIPYGNFDGMSGIPLPTNFSTSDGDVDHDGFLNDQVRYHWLWNDITCIHPPTSLSSSSSSPSSITGFKSSLQHHIGIMTINIAFVSPGQLPLYSEHRPGRLGQRWGWRCVRQLPTCSEYQPSWPGQRWFWWYVWQWWGWR